MAIVEPHDRGVLIRVKAVPGSSRDAIAGALADRLKVRVSAPPEGGRANRAIARLLARALDRRSGDVDLVCGGSSPEKTFRVDGVDAGSARERLGVAEAD